MGWIRGTGYFSDLILSELLEEIGFKGGTLNFLPRRRGAERLWLN